MISGAVNPHLTVADLNDVLSMADPHAAIVVAGEGVTLRALEPLGRHAAAVRGGRRTVLGRDLLASRAAARARTSVAGRVQGHAGRGRHRPVRRPCDDRGRVARWTRDRTLARARQPYKELT